MSRFNTPLCARTARVLVVMTCALIGAATISAGVALADSSGSVSETINVGPQPVLSVTLSTNSVDMCSAADPLTFPNGGCASPNITITNGTAAAQVDVQAYNATPGDAGSPGAGPDWALCIPNESTDPDTATCSGGSSDQVPGQDQYSEDAAAPPLQDFLTVSPACNGTFDESSSEQPGCTATPNQSALEVIDLRGPTGSTDPSTTFTSAVTWTAVAP